MADLNRKRARKSKLTLRHCEDDIKQTPYQQLPTTTRPPVEFDIKVEIESCDEDDFDMASFDTKPEIKSETINENDLFEAEENDINQLALSLTGRCEKQRDVIKKEYNCDSNLDDDINDERDINALASVLMESKNVESGKRKRVPNIKKEYDYSIGGDDDDEEHDVNALASMLRCHNNVAKTEKMAQKRPVKKLKKSNTATNDTNNKLDISVKTELWRNLEFNNDDDSKEGSSDEGLIEKGDDSVVVKKEFESNVINDKTVNLLNNLENNVKNIERIEDKTDDRSVLKKSKNQGPPNTTFPTIPIGKNTINQVKLSEEIIMKELDKLSGRLTEKVDKILEIEMRNLWGRVRYVKHERSNQERKLQAVLEQWCLRCRSTKIRETPAMYKCYICSKAWWQYYPFSEHIKQHSEDLKMKLEINLQECFVVAFLDSCNPKYLPIDENCWKCGKDVDFHRPISPKAGKNYGCKFCSTRFGSCRQLREHHGRCAKSLSSAADVMGVFDIQLMSCPVCSYKVLKMGPMDTGKALDEHMQTYHLVRSDLPAFSYIKLCTSCTEPSPMHLFHICPKRNKNYECNFCNKRYPSQIALENHLKYVADDFPCRVCGETLPKQCLEVKHLLEHSQHFGLMYKCISCTDNILLLDQHSMKKHKVIWHKQKFDRRRNYYETMVVPKAFIEAQGVEKLDIVTSFLNVKYLESMRDGSLKLLNLNSGAKLNKLLDKSGDDEDSDVCIVDDASQSSQVIELNDDDDDKETSVDYDDELLKIAKTKIKKEIDTADNESYDNVLSQVLKADKDLHKTKIKKEVSGLKPKVKGQSSRKVTSKTPMRKTLYQCTKCNVKATLFKIKAHMENYHCSNDTSPSSPSNVYNCSKCLRCFNKLQDYCDHLVDHGYEPNSCPECMATFSSYMLLDRHIKCRTKSTYFRTQNYQKSPDGESHLMIKYQCRKCKQETDVKNTFAHWESHLEIREVVDPDLLVPKVELGVGSDDETRNDPVEDTQPLEPEMLRQAIAAILTKKSNKECTVCARVFDRRNDTKRHLIEHLLQDAYCDKYKHKSLKCQICHDSFLRSDEYKLHLRGHASMPVFQCPQCGKTFSDSSNYTKHKKTHDIPSHACSVCDKKFLAKASLDKHMEIHETAPLSCPHCATECHTDSSLNRHMLLAHDRRTHKFRCVICKKRFRSLRERWDHSWLQHQERKHQADCPLCGQAYRKPTELKAHLREMHDVDPKSLRPLVEAALAQE